MMKKKIVLLLLLSAITLTMNAGLPWHFSNSTPQKLIKTHFYYTAPQNRDLDVAIHVFETNNFSIKTQKRRVLELYEILRALKLNVEEVSNKKSGGIKGNDYFLLKGEKRISLVRKNRSWYYSLTTLQSVPVLYRQYVLKIDGTKESRQMKEMAGLFNDSVTVQLNLSTPYNTVVSHLIFCSDSLFNPALAARCINFDPKDTADKEDLAIKLSQIFYGSTHRIFSIDELSKDSFYTDSATGKYLYIPNPEIPELFLEKIGNEWKYSTTTSKLIRSVHEAIYGTSGSDVFQFNDRFKNFLGKNSSKKFLKLMLWQWLMLLYFVFIYFVVWAINRFIIKPLLHKKLSNNRMLKNLIPFVTTVLFIIITGVVKSYAPSFEFEIEFQPVFLKSIALINILLYTIAGMYLVNIVMVKLTNEDRFDSRYGLVYFGSLLAKMVVFSISLFATIKALNYDIISVLTGLSIGGFALALGAQDTVKNFFGSLMIFADHSFNVGDWIEVDGISGTVEQIGLRSTRIRTFYHSLVTVPNSKMSDNAIDNMGKRRFRRYKGTLLLKYNTPPEKIERFIEKIKEEIKVDSSIRQDFYMVYVNDLTSYGIEILLYVFFIVPDWDKEMKSRHTLLLKILQLQKEFQIEFVSLPVLNEG